MTIKASNAKNTAKILEDVLVNLNQSINLFTGNDNPQVKQMLIKVNAERDMVEAVLQSLNGNTINIKCY